MEPDIQKKIEKDFEADAATAIDMIDRFEQESSFGHRITRCIIHLAHGSIAELKKGIEAANTDWRDVIVRAERFPYEFNEKFEE